MANYNIVVDTSNFKPYDISPALLILHDYRDAYYKLEDQLEKISEKNGEVALPQDSAYKLTIDDYNTELQSVTDAFSKGMTVLSRADINKLRNKYARDIKPIKDMVDAYNKDVDLIKAAKLNNPDLIVVGTPKVDDYYNKGKSNIRLINGESVTKGVAAEVKSILETLPDRITYSKDSSAKGYLTQLKLGILSVEDLTILALNPNGMLNENTATDLKRAAGLLLNYFLGVYRRYGYYNSDMSEDNRYKLKNCITLGALLGIKPTETNTVLDKTYLTPLTPAEIREQQRKDAEYKSIYETDENGNPTGNYNLNTQRGRAAALAAGYKFDNLGNISNNPTSGKKPTQENTGGENIGSGLDDISEE